MMIDDRSMWESWEAADCNGMTSQVNRTLQWILSTAIPKKMQKRVNRKIWTVNYSFFPWFLGGYFSKLFVALGVSFLFGIGTVDPPPFMFPRYEVI